MTAGRQRLDDALVARNLAESRARARALVLAGDVLVDGQVIRTAGKPVRGEQEITLRERPRFVSRGGEKLDHALTELGVDVRGWTCADFGASTGGFTDCLLSRGAARVYAIDVGYGQLHKRIRDDVRVVAMDRTNARLLEQLPESIDLVAIDVSFISLALVLPVAAGILKPNGWCVPLIKPQFEAGRGNVGKGGVVRDPAVHREVIERTIAAAEVSGFGCVGVVQSPLTGPAGNIEFLAGLRLGLPSPVAIADMIESLGLNNGPV
jgi:23S rRNA (cytidine1920-2'-O)/16S rRNA (cytidine1409-2'-O)-methyltransferase